MSNPKIPKTVIFKIPTDERLCTEGLLKPPARRRIPIETHETQNVKKT
jgi:hypothetical protein